MLFWLGFETGLIQNFNAASDEKQNIKKQLIKFWKPELRYCMYNYSPYPLGSKMLH
jgi:hypothetical protein